MWILGNSQKYDYQPIGTVYGKYNWQWNSAQPALGLAKSHSIPSNRDILVIIKPYWLGLFFFTSLINNYICNIHGSIAYKFPSLSLFIPFYKLVDDRLRDDMTFWGMDLRFVVLDFRYEKYEAACNIYVIWFKREYNILGYIPQVHEYSVYVRGDRLSNRLCGNPATGDDALTTRTI